MEPLSASAKEMDSPMIFKDYVSERRDEPVLNVLEYLANLQYLVTTNTTTTDVEEDYWRY